MNTPISPKLDKLLLDMGIDMPVSPTIADVVMWIYNTHGIWIEVVKPVRQKQFRFNVDNKDDINEFTSVVCFNSPSEAYEAAIKYVCEYKIK